MKYLNLSVCFILFVLLQQYAICQRYHFKTYSLDDGLVQSQVRGMAQDQKGYLWFGTLGGGVSRFDGKQFTTFTTADGLCSNSIYTMLSDNQGNIWFSGYGDNGVTRFTPPDILNSTNHDTIRNDGTYKSYTIQQGLIDNWIYDIFEDKKGNIWFGSKRGISVYPQKPANIDSPFVNIFLKDGLSDSIVTFFASDNFENMWAGTYNGLTKIRLSNKFNEHEKPFYILDKINFGEKKDNYILDLALLPDDTLLIFTGTSIHKLDLKTSAVRGEVVYTTFSGLEALVSDGDRGYYEVLKDSKNNIWIGVKTKGIYLIKLDENSHNIKVVEFISTKNGLPSNDITRFMEDREGNIWISLDGVGVTKFRNKMFSSINETDGLGNNTIMTILENKPGEYWMGTLGGGINIYNANTGLGKQVTKLTKENGLVENYIYSFIKDRKGIFWISTCDNGLTLYDGKTFKNYNTNNGLQSNFIYSISEDVNDNIWIAVSRGITKCIRKNDGKLEFINLTTEEGLPSGSIYDITSDNKGNLWLGTTNGVHIISRDQLSTNDLKSLTFKSYTIKEGLVHNDVLVVKEDSKGYVWICTYGGGVSRFDPNARGNPFLNITSKDGLGSDLIYLTEEDNKGNIWFGTNKGIDKLTFLDDGSFKIKNYDKFDGFTGIETNHNASYKDSKGRLWFGTVKGAFIYDPDEDKINDVEPLTSILDLRIELKDVEIPTGNIFSYQQNHLTFDFIGISTTIPEKVRYQWKMDGFDKEWSPISQETYATYSNLPSGTFIFMVKSCNNEGIWNSEPAQFTFTILPPFWQTWWFYTLMAVIGSTVIFSFIKMREKNLQRQKQFLENQVKHRTQQLSNSNLQLAEKNTALQESYQNITILSEIGKQITSTLDLEKILMTVYNSVNKMMDASIFGIGRYLPEENCIEYKLAIYKETKFKPYKRDMSDKNQFPVWCIENKQPVFMNDVHLEYSKYLPDYTDSTKEIKLQDESQISDSLSMIYLPIILQEKVYGIITAQSLKKNVYSGHHLQILQTLASYLAIAMANSDAYEQLNLTYQTLTQAHHDLKQAQTQLVQAEKMAGLGQLTAGIAHEINNPVNFVSANVKSLRRDVQDIIQVIYKYNDLKLDNGNTTLEQINAYKKEIEFEYVVQEIDNLLKGMEEGAKRTAEIVKGLRSFSRTDEADMKKANIHECIDGTLLLLYNKYKNRIFVQKEYSEEIPFIDCYPGQINQVFMNLLANAIESIPGKGEIRVKTYPEKQNICISIKDNGSGMTEEVRSKIFEPFFTTKKVGEGTGLGLSITFGIIKKHNGKIVVNSVPGQGSEFIVTVPVVQSNN